MPRMLRPKMTVLPDSALAVAKKSVAASGPTHEVLARQPYFARDAAEVDHDSSPDGHLAQGDRVWLVGRSRGPMCRVRDAQGRLLATLFSGLRKLS